MNSRTLTMSYTVIARRYRPQIFEDVVGQSAIATTLQNAIKESKTSHAYIFAGDRGVGKTSMARIFAKALNCQSGSKPTIHPCDKCDSCVSISEGNNPDVIEIDAASQTKIEDVRVLQEGVGYVPLRGRYKIYIMDEAHQLSKSAFNALLKTIEEPPPHVKFIFATTEPHKLPETIISRCQRFNFRRISPQDIYQRLEEICKKEKVTCDKTILAMVAQRANGSMRDSETILDQLISFGSGKISQSDMELLMGGISLDAIFNLIDSVYKKDLSQIIAIIDDAFAQGKDIEVFFDQIVEHLWRLILIKVNPNDSALINREIIQDKEKYQAQAQQFKMENLLEYVKQLAETRWRLKDTSNIRILTELVLLRIATSDNGLRLEKTESQNTEKATSKKQSIETKPTIKNPAPQEETEVDTRTEAETHVQTVNIDEIGGLWGKIMEEIKRANFKVHAYLKEAHFVRADNQEIVVGFPPQCNFHRRMFDDVKYKKVVEEYILKVTGLNLSINMIISEDSRPSKDSPADLDVPGTDSDTKFIVRDKKPQHTDDKNILNYLMDNPIIRKVQEEFDGRIIKMDDK